MIIDELRKRICNEEHKDAHFENLQYPLQIWIENLCDLIEEKLDKLDGDIEHLWKSS